MQCATFGGWLFPGSTSPWRLPLAGGRELALSHLRWGHGTWLVLARSASEFAFWATRHRAAVTLTYRCSRGQQHPVLETSVQE